MNSMNFHWLWLKNRFRQFNRNQSGATDVSNVMWIAVGVLILVSVISLVTYFLDYISGQASDIVPGEGGNNIKPIGGN